jgi:amidophosphoribosyltransferase
MDVDAMARHIGVDSLAFISIDGLYRAVGIAGRDDRAPHFCDACFTGDYPIPLVDAEDGKVSVQLSLLAPA